MATALLNNDEEQVDTGRDAVVIVKFLEGIPGGRTLSTEGFSPTVIRAGHVVIRKEKEYRPMPVNAEGNAYGELPDGFEPVGVAVASILTAKPMAAIMVRGSVNEAASPYPIPASIKEALPLIRFTKD